MREIKGNLKMETITINGEMHVLGTYSALRILAQSNPQQARENWWREYFPTFAPVLMPLFN
jgi:hypothetical protein